MDPNEILEVTNKHYLEPSIIYNAPFAAVFLKIILSFSTFKEAPLQAFFLA